MTNCITVDLLYPYKRNKYLICCHRLCCGMLEPLLWQHEVVIIIIIVSLVFLNCSLISLFLFPASYHLFNVRQVSSCTARELWDTTCVMLMWQCHPPINQLSTGVYEILYTGVADFAKKIPNNIRIAGFFFVSKVIGKFFLRGCSYVINLRNDIHRM